MKWYMSALFLLLSVLLVSPASYAAEDGQPLAIQLNILSGQIKLTRIGETMSDIISNSVPLYPGDLLETLRESKAELVYADGTKMRIKPLTLLELQATSIKVFKGKTWFNFVKRGSEFLIETPSLVAGIRGTTFDIGVSSHGKSVLSVMEGAVEVKGKDRQDRSLLIRRGFATHCDLNDNPVPPYKFNLERKQSEWRENDWFSGSEKDVHQLFINYLNLKNNYGETDARTIEALKSYDEAKKKLNKGK